MHGFCGSQDEMLFGFAQHDQLFHLGHFTVCGPILPLAGTVEAFEIALLCVLGSDGSCIGWTLDRMTAFFWMRACACQHLFRALAWNRLL
jgi:hypothetical protein